MMRIEVTIPEEDIKAGASAQYLAQAMQAIGFSRGVTLPLPQAVSSPVVRGSEEAVASAETFPEIRYFGQAALGRSRRTKAEITFDEEAADLLEEVGLTVAQFNDALKKANGDWDAVMADLRASAKAKSADPTANISTGEERIDPETDVEAEAEATDEPLTHDDVRDALGDYAAKFGMPAAQKNGPGLMGADKISAIPNDQAALRKAVSAIRNAIGKGVE
jgi:hypothetical protein